MPSAASLDLPAGWRADQCHDGGDLACGELLIDLHQKFKTLQAGTVVAVRSVDEGAPVEIPAWCRVLGHDLLDTDHPFYLIRRQ